MSKPIKELSRKLNRNKVVSAAEAVSAIRSGDMVATGGFVGIGFAEQLTMS